MAKYLYTVVCRHCTIDGIFEVDLYEVFRRLHIDPVWDNKFGIIWGHERLIYHYVYSGQAVEFVIKRVLRNVDINDTTKDFYSYVEPWNLGYKCYYDEKDVERMNRQIIDIRMNMSDEEFKKIYGKRLYL